MEAVPYDVRKTALLLVDPYNDFLSEGGKVWPAIKARYAQELGYHVTLVKDATAAINREMMQAAHELNGPTYAHSIVETRELIRTLLAC